jgi:hypothetical protein
MNKNSLLTFLLVLTTGLLSAQTVPGGINYQALFRAEDGSPMVNQKVQIEVNLTSGEEVPEIFYQELHQLTTDEFGLLSIPIGKGQYPFSSLDDVPWEKGNIWLSIGLLRDGRYREISKNQLLSVPYTMHAGSARELTKDGELSLRNNSSIFWVTSGNAKTEPNVHYIGTNDDRGFFIKTSNQTRYVIDQNGLVTLYGDNSTIAGPDDEKASYPLIIERGKHGIYIDLAVERVNGDNNFVTFADPDGIHGSIEGQTLAECFSDPFYIIDQVLTVTDIVMAGLDIPSQFSEASSVSTDGVGAAAAPGAIANGAAQIVSLAGQVAAQTRDLVIKIRDVGVNFNSGGADYAEWLPKEEGVRDLLPGEVVGVKAGKISLRTEDAEFLMVVSSNPILVGNNPVPEEEEQYEKIAFLGQVYVSVLGNVKSGDYILPSGNNDGFAIAVHPADMKSGDYNRIIGVAWEGAEREPGLSHAIKTAIGINANDLSDKVSELEIKADQIVGYLKGENPMPGDDFQLSALEKQNYANQQAKTHLNSRLSEEEFSSLIDAYGPFLNEVYSQTRDLLAEEGISIDEYPMLQLQFEDPVAYLKELKKDPNYRSQMAVLELSLLRIN